jgi:hypothetical protein
MYNDRKFHVVSPVVCEKSRIFKAGSFFWKYSTFIRLDELVALYLQLIPLEIIHQNLSKIKNASRIVAC